MLTTTTICFGRDKAYSDALDILLAAHCAADSPVADEVLSSAILYLSNQWANLQTARELRMARKLVSEVLQRTTNAGAAGIATRSMLTGCWCLSRQTGSKLKSGTADARWTTPVCA